MRDSRDISVVVVIITVVLFFISLDDLYILKIRILMMIIKCTVPQQHDIVFAIAIAISC